MSFFGGLILGLLIAAMIALAVWDSKANDKAIDEENKRRNRW